MSQPDASEGDPPADPGVAGDAPGIADPHPDPGPLPLEERELLAAFDRLSPQGSLTWGFDDAMRRIEHPEVDAAAGGGPWKGLPDDLWDRGRSARIGQRFVGDVAGVLAELLAADARSVAASSSAAVNTAVWDALRYLAARVEVLEARTDPLALETAEWPAPDPDPGAWVVAVADWLGRSDSDAPVVVGESGDGALLVSLEQAGHRVVGVEPRGVSVWSTLAPEPSSGAVAPPVVLSEVRAHLATLDDDSAAGAVLVGCVDRLDLVGQVELLTHSVRVVEPGGTIVVLTTDPSTWSESLTPTARDLAPGRPLHPETWSFLLHRAGVAEVTWHRPTSGAVHAVVARTAP